VSIEAVSEQRRPWTWWRLVWNFAVVGAAFMVPQIAVFVAALLMAAFTDPEFNLPLWAEKAGSNGLLLSVSTFASTLMCIPVIRLLVGLAQNRPWDFLGIRRPSKEAVLLGCVAMSAFIVVSDSSNVMLGRPLVPRFMIDAFATARWPVLLLAALSVAAPIGEELFFRGLILGGLQARHLSALNAAIISSLIFAALHLQYDLFDMVSVFFMGLLFAGARLRSGSIIPGIAMHAMANAVGFIEVALTR